MASVTLRSNESQDSLVKRFRKKSGKEWCAQHRTAKTLVHLQRRTKTHG